MPFEMVEPTVLGVHSIPDGYIIRTCVGPGT